MKPPHARIAICQIRPVVGDIDGNITQIIDACTQAATAGADLALFPECAVSGYPAEDLWLDTGFVQACTDALDDAARSLAVPAVVGCPRIDHGHMRNACAVVRDGRIDAWYDKQCLPNYGVFDEERWFDAGTSGVVITINDARIGISICEDLWIDGVLAATYPAGTIDALVNASASPFHVGRASEREAMTSRRAVELGVPVVLCNQVGGQDELVFDGGSVAVTAQGVATARVGQFVESVQIIDIANDESDDAVWLDPAPETWEALRCGLADYVNKNGFGDVVVGVSGGIDSAVVATLAVDALGADRVHAVTMPSVVTSSETLTDARDLARRLGIDLTEIAIEPLMDGYLATLAEPLSDTVGPDIMEENLQARIRGTLLMALSNRRGWLVLTTGNKSETAVGYSTLYGDTAGGFAPIKDVAKTQVWGLARWRNHIASAADGEMPIPPSTIDRPPTAELRHGQLDQDSLPAYDVLDSILAQYIEHRRSIDEIVASGIDQDTVTRVMQLVRIAEYKRRQSPPGVRITPLAFGRERRMPITNSWRGFRPLPMS